MYHFPFHFSSINMSFDAPLTVFVRFVCFRPAGLISAPVNLKVPLWSSGFSTALDARDKLMDIIKDKLENDTEG